jgi:hypothetical protein
MNTKKYLIMATIPQREKTLKKIIDPLYNQVDEIRLVFNNYEAIPYWVTEFCKIKPLLNTPDKYTSNAVWLMMNEVDGYVFVCDDDIVFPIDYVPVMIETLKKYNHKALLSMYGEVVPRPFRDYCEGRTGYIFDHELKEDLPVDICGGGCSLFHTDFLRPSMNDFPDIYSRDLWLSILAHKNNLLLIRPKSNHNWVQYGKVPAGSPEIRLIWPSNPKLVERRKEVFRDVLCPLLNPNKPKFC